MSSRTLLRLILLVQALFAAGIALAALRYLGVGSTPLALAMGLGMVLLVRILITANNFVVTARTRSATPDAFRIGVAGLVRLFAEEFLATMLQTSWFMARAVARKRIYADSPAAPVLLLHGYGCNSGYWAHLTPLLDAARISHASLDLEPIMAGIDDYVPLVQAATASLCRDSGAPAVIIVAHSMGGLVARAYLRRHGPARVARLITLGTPHHGTSLASLGLGRNAAQMRRGDGANGLPGSDWLQALAAGESAHTRALITSIYTHHDNIVSPQTSSQLPGARNIEFGGVGHVAMGRNPRILACVMQEIAMVFT